MEQRLQQEATTPQQPEIHLRGDKQVAYEHMIRVMAAVQRAGIEKLGFVTTPDQPQNRIVTQQRTGVQMLSLYVPWYS